MRRKGGRKGNREKEGVAFWGSSLLPLLLQLKRQEEEEEVGRGKALIFRCGGPSLRPSVRPSVLHAQGFFPFPLSSFSLVFLCYPSYSHLFFPGLLFGYFFFLGHIWHIFPHFLPPPFSRNERKKLRLRSEKLSRPSEVHMMMMTPVKKETDEIKYGRSLDCMLDGHVTHLREETPLSPHGGEYDER